MAERRSGMVGTRRSGKVRATGRTRATGKTRAGLDPREEVRLAWPLVRAFMQRWAGVVLAEDQSYLLESRLRPLLSSGSGPGALLEWVRQASCAAPGARAHRELIDALTTHETFFFRDTTFWHALEEQVFPQLARALVGRPLRIWSACCSTGQEPYSLAMLLLERFPDLAARTRIVATDIAEPTLERASEAVYSSLEVNRGLSAARLLRHFEQVPGGVRVKDTVRRLVEFRPLNLLGAAPYPRADLVLCRNVLIYFSEADRAAVHTRLIEAAEHYIGIGCAEQFGHARAVSPGWYEVRALRALRESNR